MLVDVAQGDGVAVDADPKPSLQRAPRPVGVLFFWDLPPPASSGFCCHVEGSRTGLDLPADWAWLGEQMFAPEQQVPQTGTKRLRSKPGACAGTERGGGGVGCSIQYGPRSSSEKSVLSTRYTSVGLRPQVVSIILLILL